MKKPKKPKGTVMSADYSVDFAGDLYHWGGLAKTQDDLVDILGSSALLPANSYDPANISNGYTGGMAFIGALLNDMLDGFTMLVEFDGFLGFEMTEPTFSTDLVLSHSAGHTASLNDQYVPQALHLPAVAGVRKAALTVTPSATYASIDNVRMVDGDGATSFMPAMPAAVTDIILHSGLLLKSFRVWKTPKSEADTQALTV